MPKRPNVVVIIADTFRADYLGCMGHEFIQTPSLDRLAAEGVLCTQAYADGLPTIPARRVMFTGNSIVPFSKHGSWQPLPEGDVTVAQLLAEAGYTTAFFTDTYHYFKPGLNFHTHFHAWEWIRGQESDSWKSGPREAVDPKKHMPAHLWHGGKETSRFHENYDDRMRQYMLNTLDRQTEEDYFCARSFRAASTWLEQNRDADPFFLWVDTFDPHEPWDAPARFQKMYCDKYPCERFLFGYGVDIRDIRPEDHDALRGLYAAEASFVDMWVGRFLTRLDELGLRENTLILFSSDHGTHLGEEGLFQKQACLLNGCVSRVPLIVRLPDGAQAGTRVDSLASHLDFTPTILDAAGMTETPDLDGKSLMPLLQGKTDAVRESLVVEMGGFAAACTPDWYYFQHKEAGDTGKGPALYKPKTDPCGMNNILADHADVVPEMRAIIAKQLGTELPPLA